MSFKNPLRKDIEELERFEEIVEIFFQEGFGFLLERMDLLHHVPLVKRALEPKAKKPKPERVRETFEKLGPTFIKFGQILSERPDLVPEEYCEELEKLEDSVPAFESEKARDIVDQEVGMNKFEEFSDEPIAAASIAQVHKAKLQNGEEVAVKIRRPDIKKQMEKDLNILQYLGKKADHLSDIGNQMIYREIKEFSRWTKKELNLKKEGRSAKRFKDNLSDEEKAKIPEVYMQHTTEKVLVLEYIDAIKCTEIEKLDQLDIDRKEVAETGLKSFLKQLLRDGFIHVDPHPSNFMVDEQGNLVYLDFGMMADITPEMQKNIGMLILHTYDEDIDGLMNTLEEMSYVEEDAEIDQLKREVEDLVLSLRGTTLEEKSISKALIDLATISAEKGVYLPTKFVLTGKGLVTMEGIGLKIYPDFQFDEKYQNLVEKLVIKNNANPKDMGRSFLIDLMENQESLTNLPTKLSQKMESDGDKEVNVKVESGQNKLVVASLILGSLYLLSTSIDPKYRLAIGITGILVGIFHLADRK